MTYTTDRNDPDLTRGVDSEPTEQAKKYLVLSQEEIDKGFTRPLRHAYLHTGGPHACGTLTKMSLTLCQTYARDPKFYGATYCCSCKRHLPVSEFVWDEDRMQVGS